MDEIENSEISEIEEINGFDLSSTPPVVLAMASMEHKVDIFDLITKPKRRGRPRKHTDFNTICANKLDDISQFEIQQLIEAKRMSQVKIKIII